VSSVVNPDVIVIGAGFAGLAAATALAEDGVKVLVLEARPGLGGRAPAFRDPQTGERIDNGQHVLIGCYTETLRLLKRVDSLNLLHRPASLRVPMIDMTGRSSLLALPPLPSPMHLLAGVLAWDAVSWMDRLSVVRMASALRPRALAASNPSETVRQWLQRHGQSPRLCELLWEPLALAALNQSIDQAGSTEFARVLAQMFGGTADASSLLLPAVPLDELYALPSKRYLESRRCEVWTAATSRLVGDANQIEHVLARAQTIRGRVIISAVPWHAIAALFEQAPEAAPQLVADARARKSSPIVTVNLWLDREVSDHEVVGLPGRTFQWVFDKHRIVGADATHLSLVSSGADRTVSASNDAVIEMALHDIRSALPRAKDARVRRAAVVRERQATFSLAPDMPPRPATRTRLPRLLLAGDWIDTGLPATIESAVVSGHAAARIALEALEAP
jgi:squalene-associated FAD-dependent desaturase